MAYARALVVGFELDYMDDLLSFADAFGALRLRLVTETIHVLVCICMKMVNKSLLGCVQGSMC